MTSTLLPIAYLLFSVFLILRLPVFKQLHLKPWIVVLIFLMKCGAGADWLYLYDGRFEERHKADVYKFFDDGAILNELLHKDPKAYWHLMTGTGHEEMNGGYEDRMQNWIRQYDHGFSNDNRFMIRFNAVLHIFSMGSVWVHMIVCNFLVILSLVLLILSLSREHQDAWILFLLLTIPSFLFWSSAMLKETLVIVGMGWFFFALFKMFQKRYRYAWLLALSLMVLVNIKPYILLVMLLMLGAWWIYKNRTDLRLNAIKYSLFAVLMFVGLVVLSSVQPGKEKLEALSFKQKDFKNIAKGGVIFKNDTAYIFVPDHQREICVIQGDSVRIKKGAGFTYLSLPETGDTLLAQNYHGKGVFTLVFENKQSGSQVYIPDLETHWTSFVSAAPYALLNTTLKPLPFEFSGGFLNLIAFELLFLWLLVVLAIWWHRPWRSIQWNRLLACVFGIIGVLLIIGWTTPVLGAIVRYKTPLLPFLVYVCWLIADLSRFKLFVWLKPFVLQEQVRE